MQKSSRTDTAVWNWTIRWATLVFIALTVLACALYLLHHSDFNNDDLDNFLVQRQAGFWHFLFVPVDVHYAPFHRLLTWLVYHLDPMNFAVAAALLIAFHVGALIYMSRSFVLLRIGPAAGIIVCVYSASQLIIYGLGWWAHAEHRVPYVFLDLFAIYHYLAWLRTSRTVHAWLMIVFSIVAIGFYEKAILIPFHMLVVGFLSDERRFRERFVSVIWPLVPLFLTSIIYAVAYLYFHPSNVSHKLALAVTADFEFMKVLYAGGMGLTTETVRDGPLGEFSILQLVALLTWMAFLLWSIKRGGGSWKIVLAMALVPLVDNLPITLSNRIALYSIVTHQYRYSYEELHMLAMLAGLWCSREMVLNIETLHDRVLWLAGFLAAWGYVWLNHANIQAGRSRFPSSLWFLDQSHGYMRNLRMGLAGINEPSPLFENDDLPRYLIVCHVTPDTQAMLPLFVPDARFTLVAGPHFAVTSSGNVVMTEAAPTKGVSPGQGQGCRVNP